MWVEGGNPRPAPRDNGSMRLGSSLALRASRWPASAPGAAPSPRAETPRAASPDRMSAPGRATHSDPASITRQVLAEWRERPVASVDDAQVAAAADLMFLYHHDRGFFGRRFEGLRVARGLGEDGSLEVTLAPNRKDGHVDGDGCPFCQSHFPEQRALAWRDWQLLVNAYPYADAHSRHTVIASRGHRPQGFDADALRDMTTLQRLLTKHRGQPVTMHYNGTAGNSEQHLHWHATHERLPVERWLDEGQAETAVLRRGAEGAVSTWAKGAFAGLVLEGSEAFVGRWAARIVKGLDDDPLTAGRYNMLLLPAQGEEVRLVLVPRRALASGDETPKMGGAWAVGGREVVYEHEVPADAAEKLTAAARAHVVRPEELAWLKPLLTKPESGVLFARFAA